jgi:Kef-type K+ transport system membrane component KefB
VLVAFGVDHLEAAVVAAIGVATSPAVVLIVANELRADGAVTRRTLALVAINNIAAMLALTILLPLVRSQYSADLLSAISQSLYIVSGSFVLGFVAFHLAALIARTVGKAEAPQFILTVGTILAAVGAAQLLRVSVLLTLLMFGICARNLDRRHVLMNVEFGLAGELFFVVLFVVTGATLRLQPLGTIVWLGLAIVGARYVGKALGVLLLARPSRVSLRQAALVGLGLTPMSGIAIGIAQEIYETYPEFGRHLTAVVISGIAIMQLAGPIAARFAFRAAGEAHPADKA